jgi:sulfonate transport system substrate-binding protein
VTVLLALAGCGEDRPPPGASAPEAVVAEAAPAKPSVAAVRLGYQKIGSPFLLKERSTDLDASLAQAGTKAEWLEFAAGPPILEAIRAGAVDIGYVGETPPVFAQAGGVPFVYVATDPSAPKAEAILVQKDSKITKVEELKGKKIALNRGSNVHFLLLRALEEAKLTVKDVEVVYLPPADARTAFESGKVDAWVIWDPFLASAEINGARVLRDGEGIVVNQFFYVARREFAEQHPELVSLVLEQYGKLADWAAANPEETSRILAKSSGVAYDALLLSEKRHPYGLRPITPEALKQQQTIADAFHAIEVIPKAIQTGDAFLASANGIRK